MSGKLHRPLLHMRRDPGVTQRDYWERAVMPKYVASTMHEKKMHIEYIYKTAERPVLAAESSSPSRQRGYLHWRCLRLLEGSGEMVNCFGKSGPCILLPGCTLKFHLRKAEAAFYEYLNDVTLAKCLATWTAQSRRISAVVK